MTNDIVKEFEKFERDDVKLQENKKHIKSKVKKLAKTLQDVCIEWFVLTGTSPFVLMRHDSF